MPPNILFILADQHNAKVLGHVGHPQVRTPNLDRLAARGVRFNRNYVANPICMPNRLSIFTGQNIRNHGLWTNGLLVEERRTLPGWFAEQGYRTASIGKIHFTPYGGTAGNRESSRYWEGADADLDWHGPLLGVSTRRADHRSHLKPGPLRSVVPNTRWHCRHARTTFRPGRRRFVHAPDSRGVARFRLRGRARHRVHE